MYWVTSDFQCADLHIYCHQFSCSVLSDSLRPHWLQYTRLPCPSPTPAAYSNSCLSRWWCQPTISSSVIPFSSHLQSFPASGSFPVSWFFTSRWPKYWSFSFSISPSNSGLISFRIIWFNLLLSKVLSRVFSKPQIKDINSLALNFLYGPTLTSIHDNWTNHSFDYTYLCWQSDISAL